MDRASDRIEFLDSNEPGGIFDLSATGIAFLYSAAKEKDSIVQLEINDFKLEAKVVYSQERTDGYRIGLHFQNLSEESDKNLNELVDKFSRGVPLSCHIVEDIPKKV